MKWVGRDKGGRGAQRSIPSDKEFLFLVLAAGEQDKGRPFTSQSWFLVLEQFSSLHSMARVRGFSARESVLRRGV